jgi:hypothetical protein
MRHQRSLKSLAQNRKQHYQWLDPPEWYTRVVHMPLSMARPWRHPKSGTYWLRKRVPDDLRIMVGTREVKRTLGTKDPAEARRRHAEALSNLEFRWALLRCGPLSMSERDAHHLVSGLYDAWMSQHSENPSEQIVWRTDLYEKLWPRFPAEPAQAPISPPKPPDNLSSCARSASRPQIELCWNADWSSTNVENYAFRKPWRLRFSGRASSWTVWP